MKPVDPKAVTDIGVRADADWLQTHWMPYTGNREFKTNPRLMVSADGAYYTDADGRRVFDGVPGWVTVVQS
jgi:beta-alanine--pyruvate transaminase